MSFLYRSTAIAALLGAGFLLPAAAQAQTAGTNECWAAVKVYDVDRSGDLSVDEIEKARDKIFVVLDRDGDKYVTEKEFTLCVSAAGGANVADRFAMYDTDRDRRLSAAEFTAEGVAKRADIRVEQRAPRIMVEQAQPTIRVDQKQPTITVDQKQPTVKVEQAQPKVTVQQPQPTVTVQQPQPTVTVQQPQPKVTVQQAQPKVTVQQAQPKVTVEQAKPKVTVEQAQPKVMVEQAKPRVEVEQAKPKVMVEQAKPRVEVDQAKPRVATDRDKTALRATDRAATGVAVVRDWDRDARPFDDRFSVEELIGRDVVNLRGEEVGEIENIVIGRNDRARYAVLSVGGFLGIGDKEVAIPFDQLRLGADDVILMSQKSEDQLEKLPAYNEGEFQPYKR